VNGVDEGSVPVRVMIPAAQYRQLAMVAKTHNITVGALVHELVRRSAVKGIPASRVPKEPTEEQVARDREIRRLYASQHTDEQIAAVLGVTKYVARNRRRALGLASQPGRKNLTETQRLANLTPITTAAHAAEKS
jgi:hypothetical protein